MEHQQLVKGLKALQLHDIAAHYPEAAALAEKKSMTYEKFLATLVASQLEAKEHRKVQRLIKEAKIINSKTLETYDWSRITGITAPIVERLSTGAFVKEAKNVVFFGPFGVGKSHLAKGLTIRLCEQGIRCRFFDTHELINELLAAQKNLEIARFQKRLDRYDVIVCDELGFTPHDKEGANLFFQLISNRYERKSLIITTNLTFSEWDKVFLNSVTTAAAIDRIIHKCETFNIQGQSFRAEEAAKAVQAQKSEH